jgi:hypothetical protein
MILFLVKKSLMGRIYLDTNGITVKCEGCEVGFKGILNGEEYEVVDNELLWKRVKEGVRLDTVITTLLTDMSGIFSESRFNHPIGLNNPEHFNSLSLGGCPSHPNMKRSFCQSGKVLPLK